MTQPLVNIHKVLGSIFSTTEVRGEKAAEATKSLEMSGEVKLQDPEAQKAERNLSSCPTRSLGAPSVNSVSCSLNLIT